MNLSTKRISIFLFFILTISSLVCGDRGAQMQIKTVPQAIHFLSMGISNNFSRDSSNAAMHEKKYADTIVKCAKVLYDTARNQILDALLDIDNRIAYWQYQKDHPWNYFVSKNPLKWVKGPKQEDELENNLDVLKSHQGELYVLLGQLSELGVSFTKGYKDIFLTDYQKGYEWIDSLLNTLTRIKIKELPVQSNPFMGRVDTLRAKLASVNEFKKELLSDISDTAIPSYINRNWFKSGAMLLGAGYAYRTINHDHVANLFDYLKTSADIVIDPVRKIATDIAAPTMGTVGSHETQSQLVKDYVKQMGEQYQLQQSAEDVIKALDSNDYSLYKKFVEAIAIKDKLSISWTSPSKSIANAGDWIDNMKDYGRGHLLGAELDVALLRQQSAALWKVILSIPALLITGSTYMGYKKFTAKSYGALRRALVDINSLFIDPSKTLSDEQYGKMLYLVHMLKKRAEIELPLKKNIRADFIADLEKIESSDLNVASKRSVIEDMFKKYSFLGLIQGK